MVEVQNITKLYGENRAVDNLSFSVDSGKVYGLLGPNGAGKTTTMNIITGCMGATNGTVTIDGYDIFENPIKAKELIGYLPENPPLYNEMTPYEYLLFVGEARGVRGKALKAEVLSAAEKTGISDVLHRLIGNLSKGYKQRVGIASALMGNPKVIILDEPTVGLDPVQIVEIRELIKSLGQEHTVILSSHILSEINEICDEVLIISKGRLIADDSVENLLKALDFQETVVLEAKGAADKILSVIEGVQGVGSAKITDAKTDGTVTASVLSKDGIDVREGIFYALKDASITLLSMNRRKPSLEEIFLKLVSEDVPMEIKDRLSTIKNSIFREEHKDEIDS